MSPATHVRVFLRLPGEETFPRCSADVLDDARTLTIATCDDERVMKLYPSSAWRLAVVRDDDGNLMYYFDNNGSEIRRFT